MKVLHSVIILLSCICQSLTQEYIGSDPASYQFSYNTGDTGAAKMFREEQRSANGQVNGKYGYVDPYGHMRIVQYEAGPQGFIARGDVGPDREAMRIARQLADQDYQEKLPILQQWNQVAARLAAGPSAVSSSWPGSPVVPSTQTTSALAPPPPPPAAPSSIERARLTDYSSGKNAAQAAWVSSTPVGAHSYANHVNHYTSNINSVWPASSASSIVGRSAPLVASAPTNTNYFNGAPQTWFRMSSTGPSPYNIAYSY